MNKEYIDLIIKLAEKAKKKNEIPIGCVILYNGHIIAKSYNNREKNNSVLGHAEIIAIQKATKKLNTWKLNNCEMYVTLKPCEMCESIIKQARINKVYYLEKRQDNKKDFYKTKFEKISYDNNYLKILSEFFENIRKNK